jgi:hypothetical protein
VVVDGVLEPLLAPEVTLRRLDGDVAQEKLNLFQFACGLVAQPRAGPTQIVRRYGRKTAVLGISLDKSPK